MNQPGRTIPIMMMLLVALSLAACSGKTRVKSDLNIKGAPKWVNKGTQILKDKRGRLFHGVGSAPPMGDMSLQRNTADNRARAELAQALQTYMNAVSRDYLTSRAAQGDGADRTTMNEQDVSREIKTITSINLRGSRIIGRYRDRQTSVIYAIAELDLKRMKKIAAETEGISPGLQGFIDRKGDTIFDGVVSGGQ